VIGVGLTATLTLLTGSAQAGPTEAALLLCEEQSLCAEDADWVRSLGVLESRELAALEALVALDAAAVGERGSPKARFEAALAEANQEALRGKWRTAEAAIIRAGEALADWPGSPEPEALFTYYALEGAVLVHRGEDDAHLYSFRQAAAMTGIRTSPELPVDDKASREAWLDARRMLAVEGEGTLALAGLPADTKVFVDGHYKGRGSLAVALTPGTHRVVAERTDQLRPVVVEVPVLGGRVTNLTLDFPEEEGLAWLQEHLDATFAGAPAPDPLLDLLSDWCAQRELTGLQVLQVQRDRTAPVPPDLIIGAADTTRSAASDGEALDLGDGVPVTATREIALRHEEAVDDLAPVELQRLKTIWFDPASRRFDLHQPPPAPLPRRDPLSVVAWGGYTGALDRRHVAGALGVDKRRGDLGLEARVGVLQADQDYALYPGWIDARLWTVYAGALWSPERRLAPVAGLGLVVLAPVALGPQASLGAELELGSAWELRLQGAGAWLDGAPSLSLSTGLARSY